MFDVGYIRDFTCAQDNVYRVLVEITKTLHGCLPDLLPIFILHASLCLSYYQKESHLLFVFPGESSPSAHFTHLGSMHILNTIYLLIAYGLITSALPQPGESKQSLEPEDIVWLTSQLTILPMETI